MQEYINKAAVLVEALPYIRTFYGKTIVVKYGGAAMAGSNLQDAVMKDIALMKFVGMNPIVVHGGGPEVSALMQRLGKQPTFVDGLRMTDAETMEIAQMVLVGKLNVEVVAGLAAQGAKAVGLAGHDAGLIRARRRVHRLRSGEEVDLGYVGDVAEINTAVLQNLTAGGFIPVIAPIGIGPDKHPYNINADTVAGAVAAALKAEKLVLLTDVEGIRANPTDPSSLVSSINEADIRAWIESGRLEGGMIPKVEAGLAALAGGVRQVHIIDGRIPHSLLLEVFTHGGIGTMIVS